MPGARSSSSASPTSWPGARATSSRRTRRAARRTTCSRAPATGGRRCWRRASSPGSRACGATWRECAPTPGRWSRRPTPLTIGSWRCRAWRRWATARTSSVRSPRRRRRSGVPRPSRARTRRRIASRSCSPGSRWASRCRDASPRPPPSFEEAKAANPAYRESILVELEATVSWIAGDFVAAVRSCTSRSRGSRRRRRGGGRSG